MNFNSRPSARGDAQRLPRGNDCEISIHAPPRGATGRGESRGQCPRISIHAPPRGATPVSRASRSVCDISIHAPPRGATAGSRQDAPGWTYFNSRPSARGDGAGATATYQRDVFQFTPLREGRQDAPFRIICGQLFQFTPLREGRPRRSLPECEFLLFQFTPLREGRHAIMRYMDGE